MWESCWFWMTTHLCNMAGPDEETQLLNLYKIGDLQGFKTHLEQYRWNENVILHCLHFCVEAADWCYVYALIAHGSSGNEVTVDILQTLVRSREDSHVSDVLTGLLSNGLDVQLCHKLMFDACTHGCNKVVDKLLKVGCDPNMQHNLREPFMRVTCLMGAVIGGHIEIAQMLMRHPKIDLTMSTLTRMSVLHMMVRFCREGSRCCELGLVKTCLEQCPMLIEISETFHGKPLQMAILRGCNSCAELLISHGADVNCQSDGLSEQTDSHIASPLMLAIATQNDFLVRHLIFEARCDVNAKDNSSGMKALHIAADIGYVQAVRWLLEGGAGPNPMDDDHATPLLLAVNERHLDTALTLLPYIGDPDPTGQILQMAYDRNLHQLLEPMILLGAKINSYMFTRCNCDFTCGLLKWQSYTTNPMPLKNLAMLQIRKVLRTVTHNNVILLKLPNVLSDFLDANTWFSREESV